MKRMLFLTGLLALLIACASEKMNFNKLQDRNGLYYLVNEDKPYSGDVISYMNGKTEFEGAIQTGLREGLWVYYYPNGQKKTEGNYKDGVKDGTWTYWLENGQQEKVEVYKFGQLLTNEGSPADSMKNDSMVQPEADSPPPQKSNTQAVAKVKEEKIVPKTEKKQESVVWEELNGGPVKYHNGIPYSGAVVKYFKTGGKELDGYFSQGKRSGKWTFYDKYGNVRDIKYY